MPEGSGPTSPRRRLREGPVGIFDSGIGGLTVARAIKQALPRERLLYFGDNVHVPYGERSEEELLLFSEEITRFLLDRGAKLIVIACNTATSAALRTLRERMPDVTFIGMEPAVKPAAEHTRTGVVGVLATIATVKGASLASIVERFAQGVEVIQQAAPGLVRRIEAGEFDTAETESMLRGWLEPMKKRGIDALVLGCTHYPLVRPAIERILGPDIRIIDPAPAIARRVEQVLDEQDLLAALGQAGDLECHTSGDADLFRSMLVHIGLEGTVQEVHWSGGTISPA
ncbi:MAG: glutamate racemase [Flavobacteriales bacterium]|nr:glutamate racemase [Flavobacteriales bacterium]